MDDEEQKVQGCIWSVILAYGDGADPSQLGMYFRPIMDYFMLSPLKAMRTDPGLSGFMIDNFPYVCRQRFYEALDMYSMIGWNNLKDKLCK